MTKPLLCFILMPFGIKASADGNDQLRSGYQDLISPAVRDAELEPIRVAGGIIHKPMFERLILCPFAVADLTTANANVCYELGVRHAFKPFSTVQIIAEGSRLPFDVQMLRTIPDQNVVPRVRVAIALTGDTATLEARRIQRARHYCLLVIIRQGERPTHTSLQRTYPQSAGVPLPGVADPCIQNALQLDNGEYRVRRDEITRRRPVGPTHHERQRSRARCLTSCTLARLRSR